MNYQFRVTVSLAKCTIILGTRIVASNFIRQHRHPPPRPVVTANSHYPIFRVSRTVSPIRPARFLVAITRGPRVSSRCLRRFLSSASCHSRRPFSLFSSIVFLPARIFSPPLSFLSVPSLHLPPLLAPTLCFFELFLFLSRFALPNFLLQRPRLILSFFSTLLSFSCFNPSPFQGFSFHLFFSLSSSLQRSKNRH